MMDKNRASGRGFRNETISDIPFRSGGATRPGLQEYSRILASAQATVEEKRRQFATVAALRICTSGQVIHRSHTIWGKENA